MQTLDWYYRRLKVMSPGEIAWRVRSSLRDRVDRLFVSRRQQLREPSAILNGDGQAKGPAFRVCDMAVGDGARLKEDDALESCFRPALDRRSLTHYPQGAQRQGA